MTSSFRLLRERGEAAALFSGSPADFGPVPTAVHRQVTRPAVVLGSTQPASMLRADVGLDGPDVVRRRSGGGAVLVEPAGVVWVDVFVPAGNRRWEADVGRAFWWLGEAWAAALGDIGVHGAVVHKGPLVTTPWSRLVCFAGLGPGEVTVGGRKVVGMAQRRTREGALFQCALAREWAPERLLRCFALDEAEAAEAAADLATAVSPVDVDADECVAALFARLGP